MQITEWTYAKTGKVFFGNQYEAADYFELPQREFREHKKAGLLKMRRISKNNKEIKELIQEQKANLEKEKKLRKKS